MDLVGVCERIVNQPVPLAYTRHTSIFLVTWLTWLVRERVGRGPRQLPAMLHKCSAGANSLLQQKAALQI